MIYSSALYSYCLICRYSNVLYSVQLVVDTSLYLVYHVFASLTDLSPTNGVRNSEPSETVIPLGGINPARRKAGTKKFIFYNKLETVVLHLFDKYLYNTDARRTSGR